MKKAANKKKGKTYSFNLRLRCVKLHFDEGYSFISVQTGAHVSSISTWVKRYCAEGEDGLKDKLKGVGRKQVSDEVKEKIVEIKKDYPVFGIKRICDFF